MDSPIIYGSIPAGLHLQAGWRIREDEYGVSTASARYLTTNGNLRSAVRAIRGTAFEIDGAMHCFDAEGEGGEGGRIDGKAYVTAQYIGITGSVTKPKFSFSGSVTQEPIESHKDFASTFGGTSESPKEGAIFDTGSGRFSHFARLADGSMPTTWKDFDMSGVTSYMRPGVMIRATYFARKNMIKELDKMTKILDQIPGLDYTPEGKAKFMMFPTNSEPVGLIYKISTDYLLSGRDGWAPAIYEALESQNA